MNRVNPLAFIMIILFLAGQAFQAARNFTRRRLKYSAPTSIMCAPEITDQTI